MNTKPKEDRAVRKERQAAEGKLAMIEYRKKETQLRDNMRRLRTLRLASKSAPSGRS